ncbi:hypothetical protein ACFQZC_03510 [Streptacidiphilus monticola]
MVWVGSQQELVDSYPRVAIAVPTRSSWPPPPSPRDGPGERSCCCGPRSTPSVRAAASGATSAPPATAWHG